MPAICDELVGRTEFVTSIWGTPSLGPRPQPDLVRVREPARRAGRHGLRRHARLQLRLRGRARDPHGLAHDRPPRGARAGAGWIPSAWRSSAPTASRARWPGTSTSCWSTHDPATGLLDLADLERKLSASTAAVYFENPVLPRPDRVRGSRDRPPGARAGAETIVGVDPISLGVLTPPGNYGADIVVGTTQPLGVHMSCGGGVGGFIATRDEERYAREYPTLHRQPLRHDRAGRARLRPHALRADVLRLARAGQGLDGQLGLPLDRRERRLHGPARPPGLRRPRRADPAAEPLRGEAARTSCRVSRSASPAASSRSSSSTSTAPARPSKRSTATLRARGIFGGGDLSRSHPALGQSALYCVTEVHSPADIDRLAEALARGDGMTQLRRYHAAVWDEPLVMELGRPGRRGIVFRPPSDAVATRRRRRRADPGGHAPRRRRRPARAVRVRGAAPLPAPRADDARDDGHQPLRHLHDEVQPARRRGDRRPAGDRASCTRTRTTTRCRACSRSIHGLDLILRELSGMDQFVFQAGGGADAAYTHACVTRAYHAVARRARAAQRDHHDDPGAPVQRGDGRRGGLQRHHAPARGGRLPVARRRCAPPSRDRTAALMVNNPDDMGIYNPAHQGVGRDRP